MKAPMINPAIIASPLADSAASALKNPPMLQPNDNIAPAPMNKPPNEPLSNSAPGAGRTANSRLSSAATSPPSSKPIFSTEPEYSSGGNKSG